MIKRKARLVAKGYVQRQGVDYKEVFTTVARMEMVRVRIALAAHHGWLIHHMDMKTAFLNGDLIEEVYVEQPPGFAVDREEVYVEQPPGSDCRRPCAGCARRRGRGT